MEQLKAWAELPEPEKQAYRESCDKMMEMIRNAVPGSFSVDIHCRFPVGDTPRCLFRFPPEPEADTPLIVGG